MLLQRLVKFLLLPLALLLILLASLLALLQTSWAKKRLQVGLISFAKENGIDLKFEGLEGSFPLHFRLEKVEIKWEKNSLVIDNVHLRLSLLSILKKGISIPYLLMENVVYAFEEKTPSQIEQEGIELPFNFSIRKLKIPSLVIENKSTKRLRAYSLGARVSYKNRGRKFGLSFTAYDRQNPLNFIETVLTGNKKRDQINFELAVNTDTLELISPFFDLAYDAKVNFHSDLYGSYRSFLALFSSQTIPDMPIEGSYKAELFDLIIPGHPIFNRRWETNGSYLVWGKRCLEIKNYKLESDLIQVEGEGQLNLSDAYQIKKASSSFYLPDLSLLAPYLPFSVKGSMIGQALLDDNACRMKISSNSLKIAHQNFEKMEAQFKSIRNDNGWQGRARLTMENPNFFVRGSTGFTFDPNSSISLREIEMSAPDAGLAGELTYYFSPKAVDGVIFAHAYQLNRFEPLFFGSKLEGNFGAHVRLIPHKNENNEFISQSLEGRLLLKNLRYFDTLANEASLHVKLSDLFGKPIGRGEFLGEKLHYQSADFSILAIDAACEKESCHVTLDTQGKWKDPFDIQSSASYREEDGSHILEVDTLTGFLLKNSFTLKKPLTISWNPHVFKAEDLSLNVGLGELQAAIDMNEESCKIDVSAEHVPLDFFTLAHPTFYLKGSSSFDGFIHANKRGAQGNLNLVLEEADVQELGQKEPLYAKGSLQAHLDQGVLQIHSDIRAPGEQFLEVSATLPVDTTLFPFSLKISSERPLSSELTMEGKLHQLFDFVNMKSHRATGLLSSHLLLSKTLSSPAVQGEIELQGGTYENYFTGTELKEIDLKAAAQNREIRLEMFSAKDERGNLATGTGNLLLNPEQRYPYSFDFNLSNFTAIHFDSVTASFTGPLHITGNQEGAKWTGTFTVPQADLKIPEELISDLPILPLTYVNAPPHVQAFQLHPPSSYPIEFDLNLSSPAKVFVRGKGLDSEWSGDVHLTGSNLSLNLNGALSLTKGSFLFAGRTFNLTQGEITFSDQPTQSAYMKLSGALTIQGVTITALLHGPFSAPQLTFQSMPQMPTSSLLSLILFDKDVSEISPFQAIQLAQAIVSLSGGAGPDVLEAIRKSLGVDRLSITSSQSGNDEISVQIGKYLTRGVLITLSQGTTTSQVIVEVDLKHGFIFQAETQPEQAGKFSLKWNKNY